MRLDRVERSSTPSDRPHYTDVQPPLLDLTKRGKRVVVLVACYLGNVKGPPVDASRVVADLAADEKGVIVFASASFAATCAPGPRS
jgi:hypothetical protein